MQSRGKIKSRIRWVLFLVKYNFGHEIDTSSVTDKDPRNKIESLHLMVQIKYHRSNSVQTATSFKILNDKAVYISLDL